jgi:hypothetical protein
MLAFVLFCFLCVASLIFAIKSSSVWLRLGVILFGIMVLTVLTPFDISFVRSGFFSAELVRRQPAQGVPLEKGSERLFVREADSSIGVKTRWELAISIPTEIEP